MQPMDKYRSQLQFYELGFNSGRSDPLLVNLNQHRQFVCILAAYKNTVAYVKVLTRT
jgi:hypothetical protein